MSTRARFTTLMIIALGILSTPAHTGSQGELAAAANVGRLTGQTVVLAEGGSRIGKLEASVEYSAATRTGTVTLEFAPPGGGTILTAKAQVLADSSEEGFGAVTALAATLSGRPISGSSSLRLSQVRVEGDVDTLRTHADQIATWWDAQGEMTVNGYESPVVSIGNAARLQINVWGTDTEPTAAAPDTHGYAILLFDPSDPTHIVSGRIVTRLEHGSPPTFLDLPLPAPFNTHATLTAITQTTTPNDFLLCIGVGQLNADCSNAFGPRVRAELAIDILDDGTIDVRGVADLWIDRQGVLTVEGTGNARFDPPRN